MFGINVTEMRTAKIKFCKRVHLTFECIWLSDDTRAGLNWNGLEEIRGPRRKEGNYASRMKDHVINVQRTPSAGDIKFQHEKGKLDRINNGLVSFVDSFDIDTKTPFDVS